MKRFVIFILAAVMLSVAVQDAAAESITCWFPPAWKAKRAQAREITRALARNSGFAISPRIARSYAEILTSFSLDENSLVYVGSFVQAIIHARGLGTPLAQAMNGMEFYSGIMVYPLGEDPTAILEKYPEQIAFTKGASSGESSAKAATGGRAAIPVASHEAAASAVKAGKAKAAFVKNWWWEANREKFLMLAAYKIPGVSEEKNPDNVLSASRAVPAEMAKIIASAAMASKDAFGADSIVQFDNANLAFSLSLMKKGSIDPMTYSW